MRGPGVLFLQAPQSIVEGQHLIRIFGKGDIDYAERNAFAVAAALEPGPLAGVLNEYSPHRFGRRVHQVLLVGAVDFRTADQSQIGLVHQLGGAQSVVSAFALHLLLGHGPQLPVDLLEKLLEGLPRVRCRRIGRFGWAHDGELY